ncbi:hypothetical protein ACFXGR_41130 [Streptomyces mirabilis]|uniref:hypothetical protein n=1 Tax=Streptomyces mirabilis TaxID=68239 RepID=UPI00368B5FEC
MKLAIGDVVRDHSDMALGTVVGVADHIDGKLVAFYVSGNAVRLSGSDGLDVVARYARPATKVRRVLTRITFVIALLAAFISGHSVQELGADWRLTLVASLGGYVAVAIAHYWGGRLASPRRFRV